jgi:hypothetical protein
MRGKVKARFGKMRGKVKARFGEIWISNRLPLRTDINTDTFVCADRISCW